LKLLDEWIKRTGGLKVDEESNAKNFTFLTCGEWDLMKMLPSECKYLGLDYPNYLKQWINVKKSFGEVTGTFPRSMPAMLEKLSNFLHYSLFK
jgi:hypothetical protein